MAVPIETFNKDEGLEYLVNEYGQNVKRLAYTYVKEWTVAEDITQEVFFTIYNKWDDFRGECSYKTWIFTITVNKCKDYLKSKWFNMQSLFETLNYKIKSKSSTEAEVILKSDARELSDHVLSLPVKYREILILFYYEGLKLKEISEMTGLKVDTIKSRLKRGKDMLRHKYEGE